MTSASKVAGSPAILAHDQAPRGTALLGGDVLAASQALCSAAAVVLVLLPLVQGRDGGWPLWASSSC